MGQPTPQKRLAEIKKVMISVKADAESHTEKTFKLFDSMIDTLKTCFVEIERLQPYEAWIIYAEDEIQAGRMPLLYNTWHIQQVVKNKTKI